MDSGKKRLALGRLTRTAAAKFNGRCSFRRTQFLPRVAALFYLSKISERKR